MNFETFFSALEAVLEVNCEWGPGDIFTLRANLLRELEKPMHRKEAFSKEELEFLKLAIGCAISEYANNDVEYILAPDRIKRFQDLGNKIIGMLQE